MKNLTEAELRAQLAKIEQKKRKDLIKSEYPKFKKLEGTFWKTRNSYGSGSKWWYYTKITKITPPDVYQIANGVSCRYKGYSFQTCTYKNFTVEKECSGYVHSLGQQITEAEFNAAWNKAMDSLNAL